MALPRVTPPRNGLSVRSVSSQKWGSSSPLLQPLVVSFVKYLASAWPRAPSGHSLGGRALRNQMATASMRGSKMSLPLTWIVDRARAGL